MPRAPEIDVMGYRWLVPPTSGSILREGQQLRRLLTFGSAHFVVSGRRACLVLASQSVERTCCCANSLDAFQALEPRPDTAHPGCNPPGSTMAETASSWIRQDRAATNLSNERFAQGSGVRARPHLAPACELPRSDQVERLSSWSASRALKRCVASPVIRLTHHRA